MIGSKFDTPQNRFIVLFVGLFLIFYYGNLMVWSLVSPNGKHYNEFVDAHLNYIGGMRSILVNLTVNSLKLLGYKVIYNQDSIRVIGRNGILIAYDCIGMGVMSFFTAFTIAYPKPIKIKVIFLIAGIVVIQVLNICRMCLLALYWHKPQVRSIDHHLVFNVVIYAVIGVSIYFYTKGSRANTRNAKD
ncbi:exosortase Y [Mucilaginibacter myungsuensis]|uniref:Archaeosortase/exosortase family protein n=1 Tax=Mucilaginibacter myungsuensis TaxID=649104 RepID=A0A929PUK0_9SPHI|nr:exosortase/archaeosortase family protein [Mucilaginibacter myungsuensis]MBE9660843.1 archaeosortase/exosortase family protein [Mucilaginibacter myungsuensis]MDN3600890.1 exosortase/archaeosortase family protein [Mucilaginibacter myungsuensis]